MAASASDLVDFAARYGNKVLQEQVALKAPIWSELQHIPGEGSVGIVNPIVAGQSSATFISDGGTRPAGNSRTPVQGVVKPSFVTSNLQLNNGALMTLSGKGDSANYLDGELKSAGGSLAKTIGSAIYGNAGLIGAISSITAQFSAGVATVVMPSAAGLAPGMPVTLYNSALDRAYIVRVGNIALSATDATASVELINDVALNSDQTNNTNAVLAAVTFSGTTSQLFLRGSFDNEGVSSAAVEANTDMVSLHGLSGTGSIYGISAGNCSATGFTGSTFTSVGDPTQEAFLMRAARVRMKSGESPDLVCVSPQTAMALGFASITAKSGLGGSFTSTEVGQSRKMVDGKFDKYGKGILDGAVYIGGMRVLADDNLAESEAYLLNTDFVKIMKWRDIDAEKQGGEAALVNQDKFAKSVFFSAAFNVYCNKRSCVAKLTGINSDML